MKTFVSIILIWLVLFSSGAATINILIATFDGMVVATDSRVTLIEDGKNRVASDTYQKIFQVGKSVGVTAAGAAFLFDQDGDRHSIGAIIEKYQVENHICDTNILSPQKVAEDLQDIFQDMYDHQELNRLQDILSLWVFGYDQNKQRQIYQISSIKPIGVTQNNRIHFSMTEEMPDGKTGSLVGGQVDVYTRLIKGYDPAVFSIPCFESAQSALENVRYDIRYDFMSLQDATDFAVFIVRATIEAQRFNQKAVQGVGGAIDIAIITPKGFRWIQQKNLHGEIE